MQPPTSAHYVILCDRVFDPDTRGTRAQRIEVRDDKFHRVENLDPPGGIADASALVEGGAEVFDLRGLTVLPPLTDSHVHLFLEPWPLDPRRRASPGARGFDQELVAARERAAQARLAGVGVLRDLGDPLGVNLALASESESSDDIPRIRAAGPALHREGRYGRFLGAAVTDLASLRDRIRSLAEDPRVGVIKLVPTGIIDFEKERVAGRPQLDRHELENAVDLAHGLGKKVAAHASGEDGIRLAVEAGVDFIEHGYFIRYETMDLLVEKGLAWTPTLAPVHVQWKHHRRCRWSDSTRRNLTGILERHAVLLRYAHSIGARILAGSDAGSPGVGHGAGLWLELRLMQEAGIPAADLLRIASRDAAALLGLDAGIAPGLPADFIAVDGRVDHDVKQLENIRWVARNGRVDAAERPRRDTGHTRRRPKSLP